MISSSPLQVGRICLCQYAAFINIANMDEFCKSVKTEEIVTFLALLALRQATCGSKVKHRLRTQSRPSLHLLLQLTNPDMSRLTCMDDPSSQRFFSNSKALPNIHGTGTQLYFLLQAHII